MSVTHMRHSVINNKRGFVPLITQADIDGESENPDLNGNTTLDEVEVNFVSPDISGVGTSAQQQSSSPLRRRV